MVVGCPTTEGDEMMTKRTVLVAAALASSILVGCGSDDGAEDGTDEQVDGDVDATDADAQDPDDGDDDGDDGGTGNGGTDGGTDGDGDDDDADDGDDDGAASHLGEVEIDQTQTHTNGVEVNLRSIRVDQDAIYLDIEAFNPTTFRVILAALTEMSVADDTGREYAYRPPEDNSSLEIQSGETLEGTIAFAGRMSPDATSLRVRINYDGDRPRQPSDADNARIADAPSFEFADLPLPSS
jgi:hypothetical protein